MGNEQSRTISPKDCLKEPLQYDTAEIEEALRISGPLIVPRDGYGFEITPFQAVSSVFLSYK